MARGKITDEPIAFDFQSPDEIQSFLDSLPKDGERVSLWRLNQQGRAAFVAYFQPQEFDLEVIQNTYGGGTYKYVVGQHQGKFEIDGPALGDNRTGTIKKHVPGVGVVFISKEEQEQIRRKLYGEGETLPQRQQAGDGQTMALLLNEIRSLREQVNKSQPDDRASAKKELLEEMIMLRDLFAPKEQPAPTQEFAKMATDLLRQGMEIANMGGDNGQPTWMILIDKILPVVNDAIKTIGLQQQALGGIRKPNPVNPGTNIMPNQPPLAPLSGFDALVPKLQPFLPTFLSAASDGVDPLSLVDLTVPRIPVNEKSSVIEWLSSDNWFSDLSKLHPAIDVQRAWWYSFRETLLEELTGTNREPENDEVQ